MILELDVGNSFLKWRCGAERGRLPTAEASPRGLEGAWCHLRPARVRVASVAGAELERTLSAFSRRHWGLAPEIARTRAEAAGVRNSYADPARMGVDRWLAMLAGFNAAAGGCCVVDCGSAITVDYVDAEGLHLGGYILPGLRLMREALLSNTRRVLVDSGETAALLTEPGRSTDEAVHHGLHLMLAALAERVGRDRLARLGTGAHLYITGGDGERFAAFSAGGTLCPELVLDGLVHALG